MSLNLALPGNMGCINSLGMQCMRRVIAVELEEKLIKACDEGDVGVCRSSVVDLQHQYGVALEAVQELLGYVLSCATAHNQIEIMELLLYPPKTSTSGTIALSKDVHECLWHGMCRWEEYFPRRPQFQCCYALRYVAYAAVVCVEQNALQALKFLMQDQLLVDTDVIRCFRCALVLGSDIHAPAPEAYRPMLMLLLYRYPMLLLPHVDGKHEADMSVDGVRRKHMDALRSSLMYEYVTNPQMQAQIMETICNDKAEKSE